MTDLPPKLPGMPPLPEPPGHPQVPAMPMPVAQPTWFGTPDEPRLRVRGTTTLEVEPELAHIDIFVSARGRDRRHTLAELTSRNDAVLDLIKRHHEALDRVDTGAFSLTPELADRRGEKVRAYRGLVRVRAAFTDFVVLGEIATQLADLDMTRVDGPRWELRLDSPVYRQARRAAVRAAVQRAGDYAEALGVTVKAIVELSDTGLDGEVNQRVERGMPLAPGGYRSAAAGTAPPLNLEPQRQTVFAEVIAHFTMTRPELT